MLNEILIVNGMGFAHSVKCKNCNNEYIARYGGGFSFHLLRCDKCGKEKSISFSEIRDIKEKYLKKYNGQYHDYCYPDWEKHVQEYLIKHDSHFPHSYFLDCDERAQDDTDKKPIEKPIYYKKVEEYAEKCKCGGKFTFEATPRCPRCKSDDYELIDGWDINYD